MWRVLSSVSIAALLLGGCAHVPQVEHTTAVPYHQITKAPPAIIVAAPAPKQTVRHRLLHKLVRQPHVKAAVVAPAIVYSPVVPVAVPVAPAAQTFKQRWLNLFFRKRAQ
jgi:hypothetical protein